MSPACRGPMVAKPPCLASELAVSRWVAAQTVVHFGENWRKWAVVAEVDCALGTWGAGVSSVEGVSVDVVVFEVGLSVRAGGIATIGGFGRRVAGVSGAYGRKTPHVWPLSWR